MESRVAATLSRQSGVIARRQAVANGYSAKMIRSRVASGRWQAMSTTVFRVAGSPASWQQRCWIAILEHPSAGLSHNSAAVLHGLDGFRPGKIHVTVSPVGRHDSTTAVVHRSRHAEVVRIDGFPCNTFAQTIIQLAGNWHPGVVRRALHAGVAADPQRLDQVHARAASLRDRRMPGMPALMELLEELDGDEPAGSELEHRLLGLLAKVPGLPPIRRQQRAPWSDPVASIFDVTVPSWRLVIEADGRRWHGRLDAFEHDRWRDAEAAAHGLMIMRFTWQRITQDEAGVIDQLQRFGAASQRQRRAA